MPAELVCGARSVADGDAVVRGDRVRYSGAPRGGGKKNLVLGIIADLETGGGAVSFGRNYYSGAPLASTDRSRPRASRHL